MWQGSKIPEESKEKMGQKKYRKKTQIDSPKCAKRKKFTLQKTRGIHTAI